MSFVMPGLAKKYGDNETTHERAPKFIEQLGTFVAKVGKTTIIDCVIKGDRDYDIECEWYFEGKLIKEDERFRYLYEREDVVGLEIRQITVEDEGEYKCVAVNKYGRAESRCEILVNVEGKIIDPPKNSTYEENQTAVFKCKYDGNPRPEVKWFLGKKEIKNGSKYNILNKNQVASLEIYDLTLEDKGTYSIVVSNDAGEDEFTFRLTVNPSKQQQPLSNDGKSISSSNPGVDLMRKYTTHLTFNRNTNRKKRRQLLNERPAIKQENPENCYEFIREIGRGKFSIVKECLCKRSGKSYAAKIIKYDSEFPTIEFALDEYDIMNCGALNHKSIPRLHEAWIVRKYLVIIMDMCEGRTLLDHFANRSSFSEEDVVSVLKQLCHALVHLHSKDIIHMDVRPSNIRYSAGNIKLVDFNSARHIAKKKISAHTNIVGHLEFCAPEILDVDEVTTGADMWSVGVITYIMCCGVTPFFHLSKDDIIRSILKVNWKFDTKGFWGITTEAKDFVKRCLIRIPEMRSTVQESLRHKWFSNEYAQTRVSSIVTVQDHIKETNNRITMEEEKQNLEASLVFRTFKEEEYISSEDSDDSV